MKKLLLIVSIFISSIAQASTPFNGTIAEALNKAKTENKELLLFFTASWCGPCVYFKNNILPNQDVVNFIDDKYIFIAIDVDVPSNKTIVQALEVASMPQFFVVDSKGYIQKHLQGAPKDASAFIKNINESNIDTPKQLPESVLASNATPSSTTTEQNLGLMYKLVMVSKWKVGASVGPKFSYMTNNLTTAKTGYNAELSIERHIKKFTLLTGVSFNSSGGSNNANSIHNHNVRLPFGVGYDIFKHNITCPQPVKFFVAPYAQYAIKQYSEVDLKPWDVGAKYSVKMEFGTFDIGVYYETGFVNQSNIVGEKVFNRGFGINLSIVLRYNHD